MSKTESTGVIRVLDSKGTELKPTRNHKKVRKLLKSKQAVVECYDPFTIRLLRDASSASPPVNPAKEETMYYKIQNCNDADGVIIGEVKSKDNMPLHMGLSKESLDPSVLKPLLQRLIEAGHTVVATDAQKSTDDDAPCEKVVKQVLTADLNQNVLVMGEKMSGKTCSFTRSVLAQIAKAGHSMVVTDPYGGYYEEMSDYLKESGYTVKRLQFPEDMKGNLVPLTIHHTDRESKLAIHNYAKELIGNLPEIKDSVNELGCTVLLEALTLRVAYGHEIPACEKNLSKVYAFLNNPAGMDYLDALFDRNKLTDREACASEMYKIFRLASDHLCGHMCAALCFALHGYLLEHPELTEVVVNDVPDKSAFFVETVNTTAAYRPLVKEAIHALLQALLNKANGSHLMELQNPVHFILEDASNAVGNMPELKDAITRTYAKRNIFFGIVVDNVDQLADLLGSNWEAAVDNVDLILQYGKPNEATLRFLAKDRRHAVDGGVNIISYDEDEIRKLADGFFPVVAIMPHSVSSSLVDGFAFMGDDLAVWDAIRTAYEDKRFG